MVKSHKKQNTLNFGCNTAMVACAQNDGVKIARTRENNKIEVTIATLVSLLPPRTPQ